MDWINILSKIIVSIARDNIEKVTVYKKSKTIVILYKYDLSSLDQLIDYLKKQGIKVEVYV